MGAIVSGHSRVRSPEVTHLTRVEYGRGKGSYCEWALEGEVPEGLGGRPHEPLVGQPRHHQRNHVTQLILVEVEPVCVRPCNHNTNITHG